MKYAVYLLSNHFIEKKELNDSFLKTIKTLNLIEGRDKDTVTASVQENDGSYKTIYLHSTTTDEYKKLIGDLKDGYSINGMISCWSDDILTIPFLKEFLKIHSEIIVCNVEIQADGWYLFTKEDINLFPDNDYHNFNTNPIARI
ncbi:hypothetical protein NAT51_01555 [Flavobacterium amniphilum]|uniref:hypothetical protein n=1 Tax=Flavobacterium amniphilum TaxID=1834035 RepID=UPI002029D7CE|nr:hypothetical protein [Flavobacterium amniphilum]MCL9804192.1 hypothetical protein [Flavobacterium amniphilum]